MGDLAGCLALLILFLVFVVLRVVVEMFISDFNSRNNPPGGF